MFRIFLHIIIKFIVILHYVNSENSPKHDGKLPEETMQTCIDSFDIHKDKIIRTQDSLALGAKYIMEIELDGKQECLKYCCKTDDCDVFIFEEKKQGSCYLFHCGPSHDFKCKFTSHANYTSAVRLEEQMRRSQQEHELKSLRKMAERVQIDYSYTESSPIIVPEITETPKILTSTTPIPIKIACTRNQYECRTSGDCIAIYNVCDGIPQCTDGSDEALDLGCPTEKITPPPLVPHAPIISPAPEILKYPTAIQHHNNVPIIYGNSNSPLEPWPMPKTIHQSISQPQNVQYPPQQQVASVPLGNYGSQGYMNGWEYRQMYEQNKEPYPVYPIHGKMELPRYENEQPHIFNHKRPGMAKENIGETAINYLEPERTYESYYQNQNRENWPIGQRHAVELQPKPQILPTISPVISKEAQLNPVIQEHPVININKIASDQIKTLADRNLSMKNSLSIKKELETQKNIHPSKQSTTVIERTPPLKKDNYVNRSLENHEKSEKEHSEVKIHHFTAEHLQQNNHKDYNVLFRPRGAVISLALGLSATVIMIALITCRLRVVRRRGRRHGSYAHDADYLVNGMYL